MHFKDDKKEKPLLSLLPSFSVGVVWRIHFKRHFSSKQKERQGVFLLLSCIFEG